MGLFSLYICFAIAAATTTATSPSTTLSPFHYMLSSPYLQHILSGTVIRSFFSLSAETLSTR